MSKTGMRAYYSYITILKAEKIEEFLKTKLAGKYEEIIWKDSYPFSCKLALNQPYKEGTNEKRSATEFVSSLDKYYAKTNKNNEPELIKIEFLTSPELDYAVLVSTYGIKNYSDTEIKNAATTINNKVWSGSHSDGGEYDSVVVGVLKTLLGCLDKELANENKDSKKRFTQLSIITPGSSCCVEKELSSEWADNKFLFEPGGNGSSFAFVYFSAAMGETGDEFFKEEYSEDKNEIISLIQQAAAGESKKYIPDPGLQKDFKNVLTYSHPGGASIIRAGHVYSPFKNYNNAWVRSLPLEEYTKYYTRFASCLFNKVLFYLEGNSLRKEWNEKKDVELIEKANDLLDRAEEVEDFINSPGITDDPEGIAVTWLKITGTKRLVDKNKKLCNEIKEHRKEKDKDTTEAIFSIFTAFALVSCFWDAYCLFAEKNFIALFVGGFVASIVLLVLAIIVKDVGKTILNYLLTNKWVMIVLGVYLVLIIVLAIFKVIPLYKID